MKINNVDENWNQWNIKQPNKINNTQVLLKIINNFDKLLVRLTQKRRCNSRENITTESVNIKRLKTEHYEEIYVNQFYHLHEVNKVFESYIWTNLT